MKDYLKANQEAYEKTAEEFQDKKAIRLKADSRIADNFAAGLNPGAAVLELGTGSGQLSKLLGERGLKVDAIEYAPKMAELAARTAAAANVIVDEFLGHDFGQQKYDGIIGIAFVHLFEDEDAKKVMNKIHDLLNPGGLLVLATTVHDRTYDDVVRKTNFKQVVTRFRRHYTVDDFQTLIKRAGFELQKTTFDGDKEVSGKQWVNVAAIKV